MNRSKSIAKTLSSISYIVGVLYACTALYSAFCLITEWGITISDNEKYLSINYPFTDVPFLNIDNNIPYKLFSFLIPLSLYGVFFYLLGSVIRVFSRPRLFTSQNVVYLNQFYRLNMTVPWIVAIVSSFFVEIENIIWLLVIIHFVLGSFTYFMSEIFKQGVHLQTEQDLYI